MPEKAYRSRIASLEDEVEALKQKNAELQSKLKDQMQANIFSENDEVLVNYFRYFFDLSKQQALLLCKLCRQPFVSYLHCGDLTKNGSMAIRHLHVLTTYLRTKLAKHGFVLPRMKEGGVHLSSELKNSIIKYVLDKAKE